MFVKGESNIVTVLVVDSSGDPATGVAATLTGYVSKDGAAPVTLGGSFVEVDDTVMPGVYQITLTSSESDFDHGVVSVTSSGSYSADPVVIQAFNYDRVADHVLRRAMANAEQSTYGDPKTSRSLLGLISLATIGFCPTRGADGNEYHWFASSLEDTPPFGPPLKVSKYWPKVPCCQCGCQ